MSEAVVGAQVSPAVIVARESTDFVVLREHRVNVRRSVHYSLQVEHFAHPGGSVINPVEADDKASNMHCRLRVREYLSDGLADLFRPMWSERFGDLLFLGYFRCD